MKRNLCLLVGLLAISAMSCQKISARMEIKQGNEAYAQENYKEALQHYTAAKDGDPSFADLDRMIGYCNIGLYKPNLESKENDGYADRAITALQRYLTKRQDDEVARESLINLFLNANRTSQAIDFFKSHLRDHPNDLDAVKSIATLYAKQGNFAESMNWYEKITLLDSRNPEAFYVYGVVLYEKVAKNPPEDIDERLAIIEKGKAALAKAIEMKSEYFEALVYMNLLYREEAKLAMTAEENEQLMAEANRYREMAVTIARKRKAAAEEKSPEEKSPEEKTTSES